MARDDISVNVLFSFLMSPIEPFYKLLWPVHSGFQIILFYDAHISSCHIHSNILCLENSNIKDEYVNI